MLFGWSKEPPTLAKQLELGCFIVKNKVIELGPTLKYPPRTAGRMLVENREITKIIFCRQNFEKTRTIKIIKGSPWSILGLNGGVDSGHSWVVLIPLPQYNFLVFMIYMTGEPGCINKKIIFNSVFIFTEEKHLSDFCCCSGKTNTRCSFPQWETTRWMPSAGTTLVILWKANPSLRKLSDSSDMLHCEYY